MSDHVSRTIELVGSSSKELDDAVHAAVDRAATTVRNPRWFEATETRGHIEKGRIAHWQVTVTFGFTLEERFRADARQDGAGPDQMRPVPAA